MAEVGIYKAACQVCAAALTLRYVKRRSRGRNVAGSRRGAHEPRQLPPCGAAGDGQPGTSGEGDELLNLLREDVERKRRAEAELTSYVEGEKQKLREAAEQAKDAIDQMRQESKEIASQQHDEAMGNIDQMSLQLERDVKESQRRRESDEDEFVEWERNMTQQRNEGQFFKNLYTSVLSDQKSPEQTQDAMEDMQAQGRSDMSISGAYWRIFLFGFVEGAYFLKLVQDLQTQSDGWIQDVVIMVLALLASLPFMFQYLRKSEQ